MRSARGLETVPSLHFNSSVVPEEILLSFYDCEPFHNRPSCPVAFFTGIFSCSFNHLLKLSRAYTCAVIISSRSKHLETRKLLRENGAHLQISPIDDHFCVQKRCSFLTSFNLQKTVNMVFNHNGI